MVAARLPAKGKKLWTELRRNHAAKRQEPSHSFIIISIISRMIKTELSPD
jgi:hypothetical protein